MFTVLWSSASWSSVSSVRSEIGNVCAATQRRQSRGAELAEVYLIPLLEFSLEAENPLETGGLRQELPVVSPRGKLSLICRS